MLNVSDLAGEENGLIFSLLGLLIKLPHQYHLQIRFHLPAGLGHTEDENFSHVSVLVVRKEAAQL